MTALANQHTPGEATPSVGELQLDDVAALLQSRMEWYLNIQQY